MAKKRIRFVYRRSSPLLKCVVLATIILSTAALILLNVTIRETEDKIDELRHLAAQYEWSNEDLQQKIDEVRSVKGIIRTAGEKLGLVEKDTIFFIPENLD